MIIRQCQFCGKSFPAEEDEFTCSKCCDVMQKRFTKNDFVTTDWEEKHMQKLWKKNHDESMQRILSKCDGVKYDPKKTI